MAKCDKCGKDGEVIARRPNWYICNDCYKELKHILDRQIFEIK